MKVYSNRLDAIKDLHKSGFTNKFQLYGEHLLWVHNSLLFRAEEFAIVEYHHITERSEGFVGHLIMGILVAKYQLKGILIIPYNSSEAELPSVLVRKFQEITASTESTWCYGHCCDTEN